MSTNIKRGVAIVLAAGALIAPIGLALAQSDAEDPPVAEDVLSEEAQKDATAGYEGALEICRELEGKELAQSPCERVFEGDMLGAPEDEGLQVDE